MFQKLKRRFSVIQNSSQDENSSELSMEEIRLVRNSWSILRNDISGFKFIGAEIFLKFFIKYPDYQRQFKSFKDIPINFNENRAIRIDKKLMAHGTYVMYTIGMLVDALEDPAILDQMLKRLARNHYRRRINLMAFEQLRDTFIEHLVECLGSQIFSKKTVIAWRKVFGYLLFEIERNFKTLESDIQRSGSYYRLNSLQRQAKQDLVQNYQKNYLFNRKIALRKKDEYLFQFRSSEISKQSESKEQTAVTMQNSKNGKSKNFLMKTLSTFKKNFS